MTPSDHTTAVLNKKVVLATGNEGKVKEMQSHLKSLGFEVIPQSEFDFAEAIEDGLSFVENAIIKARHACQHTGLPAIADDSGLEVDALNGAPGIYSSRYANPDKGEGQGDQANISKLLNVMANEKSRSARFRCVIVYMRHPSDPTPVICQGTWDGAIAQSPRGDHGFGYDPIFYVPEHDINAAQLTPELKKQLSHRAKALAQLKQQLTDRALAQ